ncbi:DNA-directed DNA polymerase [Tanacetum coccineum]
MDPTPGTTFRFPLHQYIYPEKKLTMEEIVTKFINKSKQEHEEMETFIREFKTTNELLLKEQNNLLSELSIRVHELSRVLNNVLFSRNKMKGITTRGGKMTSVSTFDNGINKSSNEPNELSRLQHDKPKTLCEVVLKKPPKIREPVAETAMEKQNHRLSSMEKDPRSFTIPSQISTLYIDNALADLGANISLMPYTMYERLGLGKLKPTRMSLELTDRSVQYPRGIVENVLIKVTFDMEQSMKIPPAEDDENYGGNDLDETVSKEAITLLENEYLDSFLVTDLERTITQADQEDCNSVTEKFVDNAYANESIQCIDSINTAYSVDQKVEGRKNRSNEHLYSASAKEIDEKKPELKDFPFHLDYAYLYNDKNFPIIISSKLSEKEKRLLLQVLDKLKGAIAWKMSNIKGVIRSFCTHKILLEKDFKPDIQPQRRLNPKVQDAVKNKIVKLLDSGLIYPISDSPWVSLIHVVPKKGGMNVVLNDNNKLIPSQIVIGWRVCIDHRKLNDATRKDHFPLPFIDQMLERLCDTRDLIRIVTYVMGDWESQGIGSCVFLEHSSEVRIEKTKRSKNDQKTDKKREKDKESRARVENQPEIKAGSARHSQTQSKKGIKKVKESNYKSRGQRCQVFKV